MHRKTNIVFVKHLIILWTKFAHSTSTLTSIHDSIYLTQLGARTKLHGGQGRHGLPIQIQPIQFLTQPP